LQTLTSEIAMLAASRLLSVAKPSARSAGCSEAEQAKRGSDRSGLQPRRIATCAQAVSLVRVQQGEPKQTARLSTGCFVLLPVESSQRY
jgi:hypothetical protein